MWTLGTATVPLQVAGQVGGEPFLLPSTGFFQACTDPGAGKTTVTFSPNSSGSTYPSLK